MRIGGTFWQFIVLALLLMAGAAAPSPAQTAGDGPAARELYLVPFSHLDFFWGGTREECLARGNRIIAKAIEIADHSPEFRFLIEDDDFLANYVDTHPGTRELTLLKQFVKQGRIEIAPKWAAIYQNLPDGELQVRNLMLGKRYAREVFGVNPQVAHLGDLPGYIPQFPQILAKSGVPYMVMTRMGPSDKPLFRWKAPDGSSALAWGGSHYGSAIAYGLHSEVTEAHRAALLKNLDRERGLTAGPLYMSWGSDLFAPTERLVSNVAALNRRADIHITLSTASEYFAQAVKTPRIPETSGEIPSSWPNLLSSLPHIWPQIIPATNALLNAEKFAALNYALGYAEYPREEFDRMWRKAIEAMDHNQDGQGASIGDERKIGYLELVRLESGEILRDMLRNIAERVRIPYPRCHPIVVFNASGWSRTDLVRAHATLYGDVSPGEIEDYKRGLRLVDEEGREVPFQVEQYSENMSRALSLVFVANEVPALGYKSFYLVPGESQLAAGESASVRLDSDNDTREPRRALGEDVVENSFYRLSVDKATGRVTLFDKVLNRDVVQGMEILAREERGGNYIGVEPLSGRVIPNASVACDIEEHNAIRTVVRISGHVADIPVTQRITLYAALKRVDIQNTVEWNGPHFVRIEQLFPIAEHGAAIRYGVPFGTNRSENVIPNAEPHASDEITKAAWLQSRDIQNWIWAGSTAGGFAIAADHHQFKLDGDTLRAEMVRGTRFTSVRVVRGERVGSLQYPPAGKYVFEYSLTSAPGDWAAAKTWRTGADFNNRLIAVSVSDTVSAKTLAPTQSLCSLQAENLVISAVKQADSGRAIVLRIYEIEGQPARTPVSFAGQERSFRETNLLEEKSGKGPERTLVLAPYEIKTVALDVRSGGGR